jgi:hypothetical protein
MKKRPILLMLTVVTLFSCEEVIELDLEATPQKVVIEGLFTDRRGDQFVRISKTTDFYNSSALEVVNGAAVSVTSSDGEVFQFIEITSGYYVPSGKVSGEIGKSYKLSVSIGDQVYESEDQLLRVSDIDSLDYELTSDPTDEREEKGHFYDLLIYFQEPKETKDYYFFKFYRNDSLSYTNANDIYLTSDEALSESIKGFPAPVYYAENDTAYMEMYSLSRDGYLYFSDLTNLQFSDGGLFGPVPANPRSNISNGALGFFQVSAVTAKEIILKKKN